MAARVHRRAGLARRLLGEEARFLVGIDLAKDEATLTAAYDDAQGVTAAFNLNLLARINRELGGDFDLAAFRHQAVWNAEQSRIETIHTENSYKFTLEGFADLAAEAGWKLERSWESPAPSFAVVLLRA